MKTILAKVVIVSLTSFLCLFVSCKKDKETEVFSCDPEINTWAHNHLKEVQSISFDAICQLTLDKQKAAYRATNPETRLSLWKEKLSKLLELQWKPGERHHIELLMSFLKLSHFTSPDNIDIIKEHQERDAFFKTWLFYGTQKLGWSPKLIKSMVMVLNFQSNNGKLTEEPIERLTDNVVPGKDCTCSTESDFCGTLGSCKGSLTCSQALGCGFFWTYICDGDCKLGIHD